MKILRLAALLFLAVTFAGRAETVYWFDNFETNAASHWSTPNPWHIGYPTKGPGSAYSGNNCAMTENYAANLNALLICTDYLGSNTLVVPPADQYPRLRFWHWFNFANALGFVELSTNKGSSWFQISPTYTYQNFPTSGGVWSRPSFDLRPYAGMNIQIAFDFGSGGFGGNSLGWYVDDVEVVTGIPAINEPESFESGQGDWAVDYGTWQVGAPWNGPEAAHTGNNCAATGLDANYVDNVNSRLISPAFTVTDADNATASYWQWCDFNNALSFLEITTDNGSSWNQITSTVQNDTSQTWNYETLNLSAYIGQTVQLAFHFASGITSTGDGWFLDDVKMPYTPPIVTVSTLGPNASQNSVFVGGFTVTRSDSVSQSVTANLTVSGTATAGTDYTPLPTSVTFDANQTSTNLWVSVINAHLTTAKTVVLTLSSGGAYFPGLTTNATVNLLPNSSTTNSVSAPVGRYWRGSGGNPTYWSTVVPLAYETGTVYSNLNGNCSAMYPGLTAWSSQTNYHYNATNPLPQSNVTNRIAFNNPIVAFGEREGGTPLYLSQPYSFGFYAGDPEFSNQPVVIQAYYRNNYQLAGAIDIYPPTSSSAAWENFNTNGYLITTNAFGLTTILSGAPLLTWGEYPTGTEIVYNEIGAYVLTHTASGQASNYFYVVSIGGNPANSTTPMVLNGSGHIAPSLLYSLDFEQRPPWRAAFLDQPHFNGSPLPPFYAGMTLAEMLTNTPPVTNAVTTPPALATNLDNSPELHRHPILDNFVASMNNDPIALANYVINQIGLTDPIDYNDDGSVAEDSINPGGVTRGALGTFLEKQGSPAEECALLVYLLRQAGVPAVYEFAPHNGLQMLDARLSQMLKFQVHGDVNAAGQLYTTNTMIPVNYPWVAAYIGTNWVHIFPWLKDYEMSEGLNLFDEMPTNYSNAYEWVHDYVYGNSNLLSLAVDGDNTPRVIFPRYLQQTLLQNHPGVSVDDIGMKTINRQHYYARWQDFPTPTWLTNISTSITNLSSTALTNVYPALTNIFDTMSVEIYSLVDPSKDIKTGDLRLCDLHNREFYISQFLTNSAVQLNLVLVPFRTNVTTQLAFANDANLLSRELLSLTFDAGDYQLGVRFKYHRNRAITPATAIDPSITFLGLNGYNEVDIERPLLVGDQAAICLDYGQVTHDMLNVHEADLWQMQSRLNASPSQTNSVSRDVYEGALMYLAGMSYYEKCSEFQQMNEQWQKFDQLSLFAAGLSKILPGRNSSGDLTNGTDPILPSVDMFSFQTMLAGNGTSHPGSGQNATMAQWNYNVLDIADGSAEEHQVLNRFYQQTNAVSTVRLLQLAQSSGAGIVELDSYNYVAQGQKSYQGAALQSWDTGMWQQVTNALGDGFVTAFMTPGPIGNGNYRGMGALILNPFGYFALISPYNINGGVAGQQFPPNSVSGVNSGNYGVSDNNGDPSIALNQPANQTTLVPDEIADYDAASDASQISSGKDVSDSFTTSMAATVSSLLGTTPGSSNSAIAQDTLTSEEDGYLGTPSDAGSQKGALVADPVHNVTGEFYVSETDLQLPGPIPLALHRNYSSQNLADNQFGRGWKLNIMPYLSLSAGSTNIYAADMDGAVLAYVHSTNSATTNLWTPTLAANPTLANNTTAGVGGLANRLRDYIVRSFNGTITNYTLYGADGSVRAFQFMKFNSGAVTNARPYLTRWTDNRGNFYTFTYDTNSLDANFGQLQRVQCSNGNFFGFDYDVYGHIIDAYTGDGRWTYYDYDEYGDLETVTLADGTTRSYQYQHANQAVTGGSATYSTHLIIEEDKPDGRELINAYDSQRRVTNQLSTAGLDLNPIRTATFVYSNNFVFTNSYTNTITGYTLVIDGNNHTNRYDYANSLITKITDPLGQTIQQTWYPDTASTPGYPRSLSQVVDKRNMTNQFLYDANGNVTNTITIGDLTGDGIPTQTATNTAAYNTNSLPLQMTDPSGNSTMAVYDPVFTFLPQQIIRYAGAVPVTTNYTIYGNVTNVVVNGSLTITNLAFGLPVRQIRAYGSPDAATNDTMYNGDGFPTETIRYTGTGDPNVINTFFYNERAQMINSVDALGAVTLFNYDALNRPIEQENFDEFGNALSWNFKYYTDNGEIAWTEGPGYNPENYEFYDYDGAGRCTTHIHWRSEANSAGTRVETPAGYNLYAQSFYQYDLLGNQTLAVDPRGAMTTNNYDALCRLVERQHIETDGVTVLSTETFGYEPGGQVQYYTNALGGITATLYSTVGKPEFRSNPDGSTNAWRYYLDGRINTEVQGNGAYWQTTYDDVNRITTRIFYSAANVPEATNSTQLDRRGNVIQKTDAGGNVFTTTYDGLDRSKVVAGPAIISVTSYQLGNPPSGPIYYSTNVLQQTSINYYDAAGRVLTNVNALGESTVTTMDALGRTTGTQVYSGSGSLVREKYFLYSADHNSVTVTDGSGANAISHTTWTDTDGHTVLSIANPSPGATEFTLNQYDLAGNLVASQHDSSVNSSVTTWTTTSLAYDGMNRLTQKLDRDNAQTTYAYDGIGNLINRVMPGHNLAWSAVYNAAGQMLTNWNYSGSSGTRTNTYTYYTSTSAYVGQLQTTTDGRGVSCLYSYDDWLRPTNIIFSGSSLEQNEMTSLQYEPRGYITSITDQFASTNTGPVTTIQRSYDSYGQLAFESVNGGPVSYGASQSWDAAGRRTQLNIGGNSYGFGWQADGGLTAVSDSTGNGSYSYTTAGILTTRIVGNRMTSTTSLDGEGRPLSISTTLNAVVPELNETNVWSGDGLLLSHTLWRADYGPGIDNRAYAYANASRRLTQEQLNLNAATTWTNSFVYDSGTSAGPGVLTSAGNGPALWNGGVDAFCRISAATNSLIPYAAFGHVNGQSTLSAWLDNQPVSVTGEGTNAMQWRASMELAQGPHQLLVAAAHPSGQFTAWATNTFTNSLASQTVNDSFDSAGNITNRVWTNPSGAVERIQTLSWDAHGRLHAVTERDVNTNGYNWTATYDGLNRRLSITSVLVTNGVVYSASPTTINSYFDPQVEFLELGVSYGIATEWKLYGPDAKGKYATQNGTGCLDAVSPYLSLFNPLISDYRGDILAEVTNGVVRWNPARPTGYGAVPGYRPVALGSGADISLASAWRGHWPDITGYYNLGLRLYDPVAGMWLSYDSVVDPNNPNGCSAFGGDPINGFDSDGRCVENAGLKALGGAFHFLFSASYEEDAQPMDEQIAATYDANYKYYGNSSLYALNATFNPAVSTELNAGETFGGMGLNYNDSGQTLSYAQQVDAGGSSILGVGQTAAAATMIYGAGTLAYSQVSQLSSSWVTPGTQVIDDGWVEQLQQQQQTGPAPQAPLTVDPGTLRLPPTRAEGADPFKLSQQMQQYGDSTEGMPPIQVTQGLNGEMMINDGVTRATRISTYNQINTTVNQVPVIVIEQTAQDFSHLPTVGGPK